MSKTDRILEALMGGEELTAKQITARYGVKNVRACISRLRSEGYSIFLNKRVSSYDGQTYMKYRIGTPLRSVVAAGYAALRGASATA